LALTYASSALHPTDASRANKLAAQGLVTWVNYPELGRATGQYDTPVVAVDGVHLPVEQLSAVDFEARRAWDASRGPIVGAAITRMVARLAVGEGIRRSSDSFLAFLLSLGTQATLTAADTPDTRSWSTLPARMSVSRISLPPGQHRVVVSARGQRLVRDVRLERGGWSVVGLTALQ
jgi:hypothetical protein